MHLGRVTKVAMVLIGTTFAPTKLVTIVVSLPTMLTKKHKRSTQIPFKLATKADQLLPLAAICL